MKYTKKGDMTREKKYFAFISYKREDEKWAKWLQHKLEHYRFPTNLNGRNNLPKRIYPTFRDVTDLTPGLLAEEIKQALQNSQWLIVVCSPRSARSQWVCKEAQTFIDLGRADHIIPFVIEGFPFSNDPATECYPDALLQLTDSKELLGASINEMGRDAASIKVVARMFGLKFDTLWQRFEREQKHKRMMWIGGAIFVALLALGIGFYFVKQNTVIEKQYAQLQTAKVHQDITLAKAYLLQKRPEMSVVIMNEIEDNTDCLDSIKLVEYQQLKMSLCDSILNSPVLLVDIRDTIKRSTPSVEDILANNDAFHFLSMKDEDNRSHEFVYVYNKKTNTIDTIKSLSEIYGRTSIDQTHMAFIVKGSSIDTLDFDTNYSPDKTGIRVYSLATSEVEHFVCCSPIEFYAVDYSDTYPMELSNNGDYLIYNEWERTDVRSWFVNFKENKRTLLQDWYTGPDKLITGFSPNNRYFFIYNSEKIGISLYSIQSQKVLYTFRYEMIDDVFWDDLGRICISSEGKLFVWEISEDRHIHFFDIGSYANGVAISENLKYAAAACENGYVYIWDLLLGKLIYEKNIETAPEDVAFSKDCKSLWIVDGYNEIRTLDIESGMMNEVYYLPSHTYPMPAYLYMTKDGRYCISCTWGDCYTVFDVKDSNISQDLDCLDIISEFEMPEIFNQFDAKKQELTARRVSSNGEICIEGFSNGIIKIVYLKCRNKLFPLITENEYEAIISSKQ